MELDFGRRMRGERWVMCSSPVDTEIWSICLYIRIGDAKGVTCKQWVFDSCS